jgi:hypothetical protein
MEGKEVRFGIGGSTLTAVLTSNTATGSSNSMDDSYTSLGGMVLLVNMLLGELVLGGLGTSLYSIVMAAAIAVFLAGLMVGRTPEYLRKKIGPAENKMIMLYALAAPLLVLPLAAIAVSTKVGLSGLTVNTGPHGFTGILFAYTFCFANNGQSFASLSAKSAFYNLTAALAMLVGRFGLAFYVGNSSDPFFGVRGATHDLLDSNGGPELSSCLGPRSGTRTIALGKIEFGIHIACSPRAPPGSVRNATLTSGGFPCSSRSPQSVCSRSL